MNHDPAKPSQARTRAEATKKFKIFLKLFKRILESQSIKYPYGSIIITYANITKNANVMIIEIGLKFPPKWAHIIIKQKN